MQGFKQRFQNGFDCQGLWVEVEVEKELGLKSKKDIENIVSGSRSRSISSFIDKCKKRAFKYADIQAEQSKRLGYFMDWENSYYTLSEGNNYMIWHFLKTCHENGWIYKGKDVVPWCPRCETAISQHEMLTEDYKEVVHKSVYFKLKIKLSNNEHLLIWTTTPWTIPVNTAVAVDKDMEYVLVISEGVKYWIAKDAVARVFGEDCRILKTAKGEQLVGMRYKGPYDHLPYAKKIRPRHKDGFHTVIATDPLIMPITADEGTGLVHTSTSTGQEDHKLGKKIGLPVVPAIDDQAYYVDGFGELKGKNAKKKPELVLDHLQKDDWTFKVENYKHRYPACWRCKSELVWNLTDEWYIGMDVPSKLKGKGKKSTLRERLMDVTNKIEWIPSFGLERELDWLRNMSDWLISKKNRFWGLALPIWECGACGHFEVIGSKKELQKRAVKGWGSYKGKSPHKPQIDEIKIKCSECGELVERVEPVGNPWLDAGIVAYSTISDKNTSANPKVEGKIPYISKKAEWRKWFPATFITESFPGQFKNWFYSLIAMSTVLENTPPTNTVLGHENVFGEDGRPMHKSWGNSIEFNEGAEAIGVDVMRWMFSSQNPTEKMLFGYKGADEVRRRFYLKLFNIYNFFVTYANADGYEPQKGKIGKKPSVTNVLDRWVLSRLLEVVRKVTDSLDEYNAYRASESIESFIDDFSNWYVRRSRGRVGVAAEDTKDKSDFYDTTYYILVTLSKLLAPFTPFISEIMYMNLTKGESVHLENWPRPAGRINPKLISDMESVRLVVEKVHSERKDKQIPVRQPLSSFKTSHKRLGKNLEQLIKDEVNVKKILWKKIKSDDLKVELDTEITPELEAEAKTRQLIREIQKERKKMGIKLDEEVKVANSWLPEEKELLEWIKKTTLSQDLQKGKFKVTKAK
jgi:isoleucyl-tRNA synthetase